MSLKLKPSFTFSLDMKLIENGVAVGKFDGEHANLAAITKSNKVRIIH